MPGRFQRRGQPTVSFFAFQDIITAVIGILLVVTLLLALHLDEVVPDAVREHASAQAKEKLRGLLDRLDEARGKLTAALVAGAESDPAALEAGKVSLREQVAAAEQRLKHLRADLRAFTGNAGEIEAAKLDTAIKQQTAAVAELAKQAAASRARMDALEKQVKDREAALLAERNRGNVWRLIPERSATSKEPVLGVVSGQRITLQRFDGGEPIDVHTPDELPDALTGFSPLNQYFVFFFKPSGVGRFDSVLEAAKAARFEVGSDVLPEHVELEFSSTPPNPP